MNTNFSKIPQLMQILKGGNPQAIVMNMLQQQAGNNPVMKNLLNSVQKGNTKEVEDIVRNIARERGIDFDKEFNSFKQMF